ncbi:hypothetical protein DOY81_000216, partial [Sarcophaga bullata]
VLCDEYVVVAVVVEQTTGINYFAEILENNKKLLNFYQSETK